MNYSSSGLKIIGQYLRPFFYIVVAHKIKSSGIILENKGKYGFMVGGKIVLLPSVRRNGEDGKGNDQI